MRRREFSCRISTQIQFTILPWVHNLVHYRPFFVRHRDECHLSREDDPCHNDTEGVIVGKLGNLNEAK